MKTINTHMKLMTVAASLLMGAMLLLMTGCKEDTAASVYDPNYKGGPQPVVESVSSSNGTVTFAGISTLTITGQNFSSTPTDNIVFFDLVKAPVLSATPTQLVVKAPIYVKDSIKLIISVKGAPKYSDTKLVKISAAVSDYGGFGVTEEAVGIATDNQGNLYASMKTSGVGAGIRKYIVGPDTGFTWAPAGGGVTQWSGLKIGPGGVIYGARVARALYTVQPGGLPVLWTQVSGASFNDIDFDNLGNLWAVGNTNNIYRIKVSDKSATPFAFAANLRTVRVYNNYVYVGGKQDSTEGVWRFPLNPTTGTLGAAELFFNLSAQPGYSYNGPTVNAITFDTEGEMYLGTSSSDGILLVAADGKSFAPYYPGLFQPSIITFAWGSGSTLFAVRGGNATTKSIVKINTLKSGAPYYGAQ